MKKIILIQILITFACNNIHSNKNALDDIGKEFLTKYLFELKNKKPKFKWTYNKNKDNLKQVLSSTDDLSGFINEIITIYNSENPYTKHDVVLNFSHCPNWFKKGIIDLGKIYGIAENILNEKKKKKIEEKIKKLKEQIDDIFSKVDPKIYITDDLTKESLKNLNNRYENIKQNYLEKYQEILVELEDVFEKESEIKQRNISLKKEIKSLLRNNELPEESQAKFIYALNKNNQSIEYLNNLHSNCLFAVCFHKMSLINFFIKKNIENNTELHNENKYLIKLNNQIVNYYKYKTYTKKDLIDILSKLNLLHNKCDPEIYSNKTNRHIAELNYIKENCNGTDPQTKMLDDDGYLSNDDTKKKFITEHW